MAKKHKKKVYTKPKKVKHINKITSLHNFINSLSNPRCSTCESILAIHSDRNYCGNCNISHTS